MISLSERAFQPEDVLQFWFPDPASVTPATMVQRFEWWFRGGTTSHIIQHFAPLLEQATRGELSHWSNQAQSRLALILVFDQFPRSLYPNTAKAYAQDARACALTLEGIEMGHYAALQTPWEKTFFLLPLGHSEELRHLDLAIQLADELVQEAPQDYQGLLAFSAEQARRHRAILERFGRQPHRNAALGRESTAEELEYLASGQLVHLRSLPHDLRDSTNSL